MRRVLLIGNYGVGNLGDEALCRFFQRRYPHICFDVVSACPGEGEYPRFPFGLRSLLRPWWRTLRALFRCDGVVFGGGSLFTDIESASACRLWWWHALFARLFKKPIILAFQGIGPFRSAASERLARSVVRASVALSVRDFASFTRVETWRLNKKVVLSFDPLYALMRSVSVRSAPRKIIALIPRRNSGQAFIDACMTAVREADWEGVVILSLQPSNRGERKVCERLKTALGRATVVPVSALDQLVQLVSEAGCVVSERYHGALAALALGKPLVLVSQGSDDKLSTLSHLLRVPPEELLNLIEEGERALFDALAT
ncbi:MAG: polysaccharide pyruvyl transferase family protein [Candidatus Peregrinibacteria bacterium]